MKVGAIAVAASLRERRRCVGPKYKKPDVSTPRTGRRPLRGMRLARSTLSRAEAGGRSSAMPNSTSIEERAMANDQIAGKAAVARLTEARASARVTASGLYPELDAGAQVQRSAFRESSEHRVRRSFQPRLSRRTSLPFRSRSITNWIFSDEYATVSKLRTKHQASAADLENIRLLVSSELAADYFQLRELDAEIAVVQRAIAFEQKGLTLVKNRHDGGAVSGLDVAQQQTVLDSAITQVALLQQRRAQYQHALAVLQGWLRRNSRRRSAAWTRSPPPFRSPCPRSCCSAAGYRCRRTAGRSRECGDWCCAGGVLSQHLAHGRRRGG